MGRLRTFLLVGLGGMAVGSCDSQTRPEIDPVVLVAFDSIATAIGAAGKSGQLSAVAFDAQQDTVHGAEIAWSSTDPTVVRVSASGRAEFLKPGFARVFASHGAHRDSMLVQVIRGYRVTFAPVASAVLTGINDQGWIAFYSKGGSTESDFSLWRNGAVTQLPCKPLDLNNKGQVLCDTGIWENGALLPLAGAPGPPAKFNDSTHVVGYVVGPDPYTSRQQLYIWLSADDVHVFDARPTTPLSVGRITDINNHRDVPYWGHYGAGGETYLMLKRWTEPSGTQVARVYMTSAEFKGFSDSDVLAGFMEDGRANPGPRPAVWRLGPTGWSSELIGHYRGLDPIYNVVRAIGPRGYANAVNDSGYVVGETASAPASPFLWSPFVRRGVVPLRDLVLDEGWTINRAQFINKGGQIAGIGSRPGVERAAILLTPAP